MSPSDVEYVMKRIDDLRTEILGRFNDLKENVDASASSVHTIAASQTKMEISLVELRAETKAIDSKIDMVGKQLATAQATAVSPMEVQRNTVQVTQVQEAINRHLAHHEREETSHADDVKLRQARWFDIAARIVTSGVVLGALGSALWWFFIGSRLPHP